MHYVPITEQERDEMLQTIGVKSIEELFKDIPEDLRLKRPLNLPAGLSEYEVRRLMIKMAGKNIDTNQLVSFMGAGAYNHYVPTIVDHLLSRSEFYTAYTPYQPEISQGTLQNIYEFQTMICELFALDVSNASVYDGATAAAEAMIMVCDKKKNEIIISAAVHPEIIETVKTYAHGLDIEVKIAETTNGITDPETFKKLTTDKTAAYMAQYPNFLGCIEDIQSISDAAHENKAVMIASVGDVSAMGIMEAPGNLGADIAIGDGLPFAGPLTYGGPNIGWIAATTKLARRIPGRIAGVSEDVNGNKAYVLTMQAREQHIRREKASSNICSNQALYALANNITLSTLGKQGLKDLASNTVSNTQYAIKALTSIEGIELLNDQPVYSEFALKLPMKAKDLQMALLKKGILGPVDMGMFDADKEDVGLFFVNELKVKEELDYLKECVEVIVNDAKNNN